MSRYPKITKANTIDQRLLIEIRDEMAALTLVLSTRGKVDAAKAMLTQIDDLEAHVSRLDGTTRLLARLNGVDPNALSDDELALLAAAGATEAVS